MKDDYQKENVEEIANNKSTQPKEYKKCSEEDLEKARSRVEAFLEVFSKKIGEDVKYDIEKTETGLNVNIIGNDATFLIGYRGDTLYAIQNILFAVANKGISNKVRIILDIGGYKQKREKSLELLADKIERTVIKTRKSVTLEPMKPYERKIIHSRLQNSKKVTTNSIGEEPKRRIVVSLK